MNDFRDSDEEPLTANEYKGYSNDNEYSDDRDSDLNRNNDKNKNNASYIIPNQKMKEVQNEIEHAKSLVRQGIVKVVDRGDKLEEINVKAEELQEQAGMFKKNAKKTRVQFSTNYLTLTIYNFTYQLSQHKLYSFCVQKWKMILCIILIIAALGLSLGLWSLNVADDPQIPNESETSQVHIPDASDIGNKNMYQEGV